MGCGFSSQQLSGPPGPDGLGAYYFNPTGPAHIDNFGVTASFTNFFGYGCSGSDVVQAYLVEAGGNVIVCNSLTLSAQDSLLCPVPKTAIPAGSATVSFGQTPGGTAAIPNFLTFDVTVAPTAVVTACTPAPTKCNSNNCYNAVHATPKSGSAFCSSYLTTAAVASTPSDVARACSSSELKISSACYCLVAPTCTQDNCLGAFSHSASAASSFCSSYTANQPVASTPVFVTSKCGVAPSRISSACTCLATPGPMFRRNDLFGRVANAWDEGVDEVAEALEVLERGVDGLKDGWERGITEVEVLVRRVVGYSGPDGTVTPGVAVFTSTRTVLGSPTCSVSSVSSVTS